MKLSILLGSVPTRLKSFNVIEDLTAQAEGNPVEILYLGDNFTRSVGKKRNDLISLAQGEYVCFVDDDDRVDLEYVNTILAAINNMGSDCINFHASVTINNGPAKICYYSKKYLNKNTEDSYYRQPNHLMVWKKSIITKFPEINIGEDNEFGRIMASKEYTEHNIDKVLYHYDFSSQTTEAQKR